MPATAVGRAAWKLLAELWFNEEMQDRYHSACASVDLSPPQLKALLSLDAGDPRSMRALADELRCDASWVTGIVDGLENRGYAERRVHPVDRRIKVVALTPLGRRARARALDLLQEAPAAFGALSASEQAQFGALVAKMHRAHQRRAG